ncbi:hypothetical protein ACJMK2_010055 [Sinanodonta woodiana]|uniref:Protein disulfide-isomerase TMX3 n=1 Tax=Sinanodonta woodiana TaxID=1069815 RepID=A0ABD3VE50_SINWO
MDISETLALKQRDKFHRDFQFLYMTDLETANSITVSFLDWPSVLVLDPLTHLYYIPQENVADITLDSFTAFLYDVKADKLSAYGGTGFIQRAKRVLFDILTTVISVWQSSRWLFMLMFGLPTAVISIVCYSLCCMDTIEEELESDEDSDEEIEPPPYAKLSEIIESEAKQNELGLKETPGGKQQTILENTGGTRRRLKDPENKD